MRPPLSPDAPLAEPELSATTRERLDLLRTAKPWQIAAASRSEETRTTAAVDRMWARLRVLVSRSVARDVAGGVAPPRTRRPPSEP